MLRLILSTVYKMSTLNVAEKNSIAKQAASILSRGSKRLGFSHSKYNPVYEFDIDDQSMKFTSVRGHVFQHQLPLECKNWNTYDNKKILNKEEVHLVKCVNGDMKDIVKNIEQQCKRSNTLILWLDCDREGQAIAFEVIQICLKVNPRIKIKRARFAALTPTDIWNAYNNLVQPNRKQADAVEYRIQIDMRLGCTFTRFQTITFQKYYKYQDKLILSYGPCQMPTLGFVVQRYLEIKNFKPQKYWTIKCTCVLAENEGVEFKWGRKNVKDEKLANSILVSMFESCQGNKLVGKVIQKETIQKKRFRPFPLTTVQLQKLGTDKLKMSSAEIMQIAENLYTKGYISYPRTQTNAFPKTMNLEQLISRLKDSQLYGDYVSKLLQQNKFQKPKSGDKNDEAHTPIHPVKLADRNSFTPKEWLVYDMICRTFLGCCSADAKGEQFSITADIGGEIFKASYLTIKQRNYLQIYPYDKWAQSSFPEIPDTFYPLVALDESKTTPPSYLTQSQLIGLMEKNQIGTDSTIHQHIQNIQTRRYAIKYSNTFKPTCLGVSLIIAYRKFQIKLPQCEIRRMIEKNMEQISNGTLNKNIATVQTLQMMLPIYDRLQTIQQGWIQSIKQTFEQHTNLQQLQLQSFTEQEISQSNNLQIANNLKGVFKCPKCNNEAKIVYVKSTTNFFIGCSNYPSCKWTSPLPPYIKNISITQKQCLKCKSKLCQIQAKSIDLIQSRHLKYLFSQNQSLKQQICIKPQCDINFNDFTSFKSTVRKNQQTTLESYSNFSRPNNNHQTNFNNRPSPTFKSYSPINRQNQQNTNKYSRENIVCYNCKEKGHYSTNCNQQKKVGQFKQYTQTVNSNNKFNSNTTINNIVCFKCKQPGHYANVCPNKNQVKPYQNKTNYSKEYTNVNSEKQKKQQKKTCQECGAIGRHPKNSQCPTIKRKKKNTKNQSNNSSYNFDSNDDQ